MSTSSSIRRRLLQALTVAALTSIGCAAIAQTASAWPAKPVRVVVGFAPGGSTDVMARILSQSLSESLGQPDIIDNKPGASGNISRRPRWRRPIPRCSGPPSCRRAT